MTTQPELFPADFPRRVAPEEAAARFDEIREVVESIDSAADLAWLCWQSPNVAWNRHDWRHGYCTRCSQNIIEETRIKRT